MQIVFLFLFLKYMAAHIHVLSFFVCNMSFLCYNLKKDLHLYIKIVADLYFESYFKKCIYI